MCFLLILDDYKKANEYRDHRIVTQSSSESDSDLLQHRCGQFWTFRCLKLLKVIYIYIGIYIIFFNCVTYIIGTGLRALSIVPAVPQLCDSPPVLLDLQSAASLNARSLLEIGCVTKVTNIRNNFCKWQFSH